MLRDVPHSTATTIFYGLLTAAFVGIASCNAAPVNCPDEIVKLQPTNGDLFIASAQNPLRRVRAGRGAVQQPITLKPDAHISFYYFVTPESSKKPMIFALIRGYKIRSGKDTSLEPAEVHVSNSISPDKKIPATKYISFHEQKRNGPNSLRKDFHMRFHQHASFFSFLNALNNSYDDVDDPGIYDLPRGDGFNGFKARMQRITGFPERARCVVFTLFDHKRFAEAVASFALSLIALSDEGERPYDRVKFTIDFAAGS